MLTVRYLQPDGTEVIDEFDRVTRELDETGKTIIYGHRNDGGENCTQFGPIRVLPEEPYIPCVYVMNRYGQTVATYRL